MELKRISFIEPITENLIMIKGDGNAVFPYCHAYLYDADFLILFDPQCGKSRLKTALNQRGKSYSDIDFIINTHFHADHTCTNFFLKKKSKAKLLIHEADANAIADFDVYVSRYGMTDKKVETQWITAMKMIGFKEVAADQTFRDGEILPGGFQVIHTPGHAPGHCCFYKAGILISGDLDLASPWLGNLTSNAADYLSSIEKLKGFEIELLLPAHGQPISTNIPEKLEAFRQRILEREQKVFDTLPNHPITAAQLTELLFQSFPERRRKRLEQRQGHLAFHFTKINQLNYLIHLELLGKVQKITKNNTDYWVKIE